ncbi:MAG: glucose-6-phosphate isomerase [Actinomycetota bacterium]|nr:glucose-6-phosphate isomerase [Actinomycetota bacterium]
MNDDELLEALWAKDDTLFGPPGQAEVADRMGWLDSPAAMRREVGTLRAFAHACGQDGLTDLVVLGMGGSSLAPEVFARSFPGVEGALRPQVLDSTDAGALRAVEESVDLDRTLVVASSKSGGTVETLSQLRYFRGRITDGERFAVITDPGSALAELAREEGFRRTFLNDPDIGGRSSALSYFGLVPAALMGADLDALLAFDEREAARDGLALGRRWAQEAQAGRDKLVVRAPVAIATVRLWLEQLIAESLGKQGRGILPVADAPPGAQEGPDRQTFDVTAVGARAPEDLGRLFFVTEVATAIAGHELGVNPFDQPDVQAAKDATEAVLASPPVPSVPDADDDALRALLRAQPPAYLALLAFVAPSPAFDEAATELRILLQERTGCATTFGYGPRYLHSTGQFHKGGPPTGRFLQVVHRPAAEIEIPGAGHTFETLKRAQALGDLRTLRDRGRPAERVELEGDDPAAALRALTQRIERLLG